MHSVAQIAAIQGAPNQVVQKTMWRFTRRWTESGARIAGLIEAFDPTSQPSRQHGAHLENVRTGEVFPLFQELGPMASACHLDGAGLVAACVAICGEIERGCDLGCPPYWVGRTRTYLAATTLLSTWRE